ncbi:MAG: potassium channel protein [bacterium]|nr:potassium channel protein [bacterium]
MSYFLGLIAFIMVGGTMGYIIIEGWGLIDALYMTIITISTVGFAEVHTLSEYGKLFTGFLIISSFGTFAYAITSLTRYLIGGEYKRYIKEYRVMKETRKMNNHVIICGFGRVGIQVAADLNDAGQEFIILEKDERVIDYWSTHDEYLFIKGDSTDDEVLERAGIQSARAVITCMPKDADNIYVVLASREKNANILIVSRASQNTSVSKLRMAGANNVIMPDSIGGSHMASLISNPDVMEFLDIIRAQGTLGANMDTVTYDQLPAELQGKTVGELQAHNVSGVTIIGFKESEGEYQINPPETTKVEPGSKLFVLGNEEQIKDFVKYFK